MTFNMAASGATTGAMDYSNVKIAVSGNASNSSALLNNTSELTDEEKDYDADGDGVLSATEKAAYLEAQSKAKALESTVISTASEESADTPTVSISEKALRLQREGRPQGAAPPKPPDADEMVNEALQAQRNEPRSIVPENEQQLHMQQAITAYSKFM